MSLGDERYRVIRRLGSGGMASVHLAEDLRLGRLVALKRLHADRAGELIKRIRREARLAASLQHPNLVTVYDARTEGDDVLIVMEYVEGDTLRQALRGGPLSRERALEVLRAVAAALDAVHARGIVHRDVKPPNILLGIDGRVKLADLGVATGAEATRITTSGSVLGTLPYMAPEQLTGEVSPAVDVFALAAVAYEALTGVKARRGDTPVAVMRQVESAPPPDLRTELPDAPPAAAEVIRRGMSHDPARRPRSAGAFVAELERALAPAPVARVGEETAAFAPVPERRRRVRPALAALAAVVVVAAIAVPLALSGSPSRPRTAARPPVARHHTAESHRSPVATTGAPSTPQAAVQAFYQRAAANRMAEAWSLLAPSWRALYGDSLSTFERSDVGTLQSIRFLDLRTVSQSGSTATVALRTIAVHPDRTNHCQGNLLVVRTAAGWQLEPDSVQCS